MNFMKINEISTFCLRGRFSIDKSVHTHTFTKIKKIKTIKLPKSK